MSKNICFYLKRALYTTLTFPFFLMSESGALLERFGNKFSVSNEQLKERNSLFLNDLHLKSHDAASLSFTFY